MAEPTMKSTLDENKNQLVPVDYQPLIKKIRHILQTSSVPLFAFAPRQLVVDVDAIARQVAQNYEGHAVVDPLSWGKAVSVNFGTKKRENQFIEQVRDLSKELERTFTTALTQALPGISPEDYTAGFLQPLLSYTAATAPQGFKYPFTTASKRLSSQRLVLDTQPSGEQPPLFQGHTVSITIRNTSQVATDLQEGLVRHIHRRAPGYSEEAKLQLGQRMTEMLAENTSELYTLLHVVSTESLGKLKQEAELRYLHLLAHLAQQQEGAKYLHTLYERLNTIKAYLLAHPDEEYQVSYAGTSVDLRDLFSRADAFDVLPIIPLVTGLLSETLNEDTGEHTFLFGIKLKLNNPVTASGSPSVLDYYLSLLDPTSEEHSSHLYESGPVLLPEDEAFKRRVLHIACLYMLVLYRFEDEKINPLETFREKVLPLLQKGTDEEKAKLFKQIIAVVGHTDVRNALDALRNQLQSIIRQSKYRDGLQGEPYEVHIGVQYGLVSSNIPQMFSQHVFFHDGFLNNPRSALKYLTVSDAAIARNTLCKMQATISFVPMYYRLLPEKDHLHAMALRYEVDSVDVIPSIFFPRYSQSNQAKQGQVKRVRDTLYPAPRLLFPYMHTYPTLPTKEKTAFYRFAYGWTFSLLTYLIQKLFLRLLPSVQQEDRILFLPLVRLHANRKETKRAEERLLDACCKSIAHLLSSENYLSNTQGFVIEDIDPQQPTNATRPKLENGLSSLYAVLPKSFSFDMPTLASSVAGNVLPPSGLSKIALLIVSSRTCDSRPGHELALTHVYGEVVGINWKTASTLQVESLHAFSENCILKKRSDVPGVLIEAIRTCYQQGYRHIFYIAKSPYTSTLHLTQEEKDEELFFMNVRVLQAMKEGRSDLKLYPVFFEKYHVVKRKGVTPSSYLIPHVADLTKVIEDPSKKSVAFFNLLNGFSVGKRECYHGVISYSTLLNRYEGILDDKDIWLGLIAGSEDEPNPLKDDLLRSLVLFHFARYEKETVQMFKLDPYDHIIGSDSIGALSFIPHTLKSARFHTLAFLTEVRHILNTPPSQLVSPPSEGGTRAKDTPKTKE
jgi:hypothetical protein